MTLGLQLAQMRNKIQIYSSKLEHKALSLCDVYKKMKKLSSTTNWLVMKVCEICCQFLKLKKEKIHLMPKPYTYLGLNCSSLEHIHITKQFSIFSSFLNQIEFFLHKLKVYKCSLRDTTQKTQEEDEWYFA